MVGVGIVRRADEIGVLETFVRRADDDLVAAVISGEPGIGKTTVWERIVGDARRGDATLVLSARSNETERELAFTTLGDLLRGVPLGTIDYLPPPQRHALQVALLLTEPTETSADWRVIGTAVLGVIERIANEKRVLLAIDDAQWIDASSARVLEFALRRVRHDRTKVVVTERREDPRPLDLVRTFGPHNVLEIALEPLDLDGLAELLETRLGVVVPRPRLKQLHERSGGNPFFALELARPLRDEPDSGRLALPSSLHELVAQRLRDVPVEAQRVLRFVAASARPTRDLVRTAIGDEADIGLTHAEAAGIIAIGGGSIRFAHPLLASAVETETPATEWAAAHARLADVITEPEERARHLARATPERDEEVASALEDAAGSAWRRGAPDVAAELCDMSLERTPIADTATRIRRTIRASEFHYYSGDATRSVKLLEDVLPSLDEGATRADVLLRLAWFSEQDIEVKNEMFEQAIAEAEDNELISAQARVGLAYSSMRAGRVRRAASYWDEALTLAEGAGDPIVIAQAEAAFGLTKGLLGDPSSEERLRAAIARGTPDGISIYDAPETMLGLVLMWSDRLNEARSLLEEQRRRATERGDENSLAGLLIHLTELETRAADYVAALGHATTGRAVYARTRGGETNASLTYALAMATAHIGDLDRAHELATAGLQMAVDSHDRVFLLQNASVLGFLELSRDDPGAAYGYLRDIPHLMLNEMQIGEAGIFRVMPDAIEAAVRTSQLAVAREWLSLWREKTRMEGRSWALGTSARCDALIALTDGDGDGAAAAAGDALEHLDVQTFPLDRARTSFVVAEIHHRANRDDDARSALDEAARLFERIGAAAWRERVDERLRAIGAAEPVPTPSKIARTFMFTDIVSSTALVDVVGDDAWNDLVRWHDHALREAFREFGGEEVDHAGDGFFVAFADSSSAVDCATTIQRRLLAHRRQQGFAPLVRIGLHAAETSVEDGAYRGKEVHRAARIGAVAGAGEIVASSTTVRDCRGLVTEPARSVELKGFSEPIDVVSIRWDA